MLFTAFASFLAIVQGLLASTWTEIAMRFMPFALLFELPITLLVMVGMLRYAWRRRFAPARPRIYFPKVSCIITCYSEGEDVVPTLTSLVQQVYPGVVEIIAVIDGAVRNDNTLQAVRRMALTTRAANRKLLVLPRWQRGGRVSSLNLGLSIASGDIIMALDGDTSFDNDMVLLATRHFADPKVIAVSGNLRVRNASTSLITRLQSMQYLLSISGSKTGLSEFNIINNISGAFGVFRATVLRRVHGWDAGTAEDLDLTQRLKQLFGADKSLRIVFDPEVIGHTDAPASWKEFFWQRMRWDGDLWYIYVGKYRNNMRPRMIGWRNFLAHLITGVLFQIMMPFLILVYASVLLLRYDTGLVLGVIFFVHLVYVAVLLLHYALYWLLISERKVQDSFYFLLLPFYPIFAFLGRINSAIALLNEVFNHGHLDSSMAPWWVLRKTKY